jgi:hypothetical protein
VSVAHARELSGRVASVGAERALRSTYATDRVVCRVAGTTRKGEAHGMSTLTLSPSTTPIAQLLDLSGKTAIVTGGAMGIGAGIAGRLHEAGAAVVIADLDPDAAESAATGLNERREHSALSMQTDVSDAASVAAMVSATVERFGGLDILVNNAGIYPLIAFREIDAAAPGA